MAICVDVALHGVDFPVQPLADYAQTVLTAQGIEKAELSILLCDDEFIQALNARYRNQDAATDILSFSMNEGEAVLQGDHVMGDVVISLQTAERHAADERHSMERELGILLIHGILHLLGYDHERVEDARVMEGRERELLSILESKLGLPN